MNAEVLVKFRGDTKNLDQETSKAQGSLKGFASGVGTAFKVATAAIVTAGVAVGNLVKKSAEAYGEFEQLEGGTKLLFGSASDYIIEKSEEAYKSVQMSQNEYLKQVNGFAVGLKESMGGNEQAAARLADKIITAEADIVAATGNSQEAVQNAFNGIMKGNFMMLDNLQIGIKPTKEGMQEVIDKVNEWNAAQGKATNYQMDNLADMQSALVDYIDMQGISGYASEEAAKTITGSLSMTKAAWSNFITGLSKDGADIDGLIDNLVNSALKFGENIMPVIMRALNGISQAIPQLATAIGQKLPELLNALLPSLVQGISALLDSIVNALPGLLEALIPVLTQALISLMSSLMKALPYIIKTLIKGAITVINSLAKELPTLIPIIVEAIIDSFISFLENIDAVIECGINLLLGLVQGIMNAIPVLIEKLPFIIENIINGLITGIPRIIMMAPQIIMALITGLIQAIPTLIQAIPQIIAAIANGLIKGFSKIIEIGKQLLSKLWEGIQNFVPTLLEKIKSIPSKILTGIKNGLSGILNIGVNLVKGLWNGIKNAKDWVLEKIKGFGKAILNGIKGIFGIHSPSTEFEWIGKMNMVGFEQGMEGMKDQVQSTIDSVFDLQPNVNGNMTSSYSPNLVVNVQNNMETDPLGQLVNNIKTFSGGAKNDYNWGAGV